MTLRIDHLDLDIAHDDELPGYAPATAPAYDSGAYDEPFVSYCLRKYDRKTQILGASAGPSYRITTNSFRVFSKKPDMEVLYTSPDMSQRNIASIVFDNNGGYPWRPRAHFDHTVEDGLSTRYDMESQNFEDWTMTLGERAYVWRLDMRPLSLVLCGKGESRVIARFTYSEKGVLALRGTEMGELKVYRDGLTLGSGGVEKLVCGMMVVVTFFKKMGRNYTNKSDGLVRVDSATAEIPLPSLHRGSTAGYSSPGNWAG
jgi:hypothetical protein